MIRTAADMSQSELNKVIHERGEARMILMRWLKKHPDSALAPQTHAWLSKTNRPGDILRSAPRRGDWVIRYGKTKNYYDQLTAIGPKFGVPVEQAARFDTKSEAEHQINRFSVVSSVMCEVVRASKEKPSKKRRSKETKQ